MRVSGLVGRPFGKGGLKVEELAAISFVWNLAGLEFTKNLITIARNKVIGFVSKPAWQHSKDGGESVPDST
jgi:hypothetical protein